MTWEETPKDLEAYQATLDAQAAVRRGLAHRRRPGSLQGRPHLAGRQPGGGREAREGPEGSRRCRGGRATAADGAPAAVPAAAAAVGAAPVMATAAAVTTPVREAPLPTGNVPTPKKGVDDKHRLLALVPPEGIQRVEREQGDRVNVWPHLLIEEFVAMFILLAALTIFSTFINAPLRELANPNLTPNPSKAPWYFLGLQELLRYFHPMIAGITIPTFILVGLAAVPYVDRNPSTKPGDRKIAITLMTILFMFGATLTIIGSFFRGPGYNWVWPWAQGVFFEL